MATENRNGVYVSMMVDSLKRKETILSELLSYTKEQEEMLKQEELDADRFNETLELKGSRIDELGTIDEGFDTMFKLVEKEIKANSSQYKEEVQTMQTLIGQVSELGMQIQALERQNSERFKKYLAKERKVIHDYRINSKTASGYYQNMANTHKAEQSYFFNEKK
ncbi:MAG: flagellar export chaperone FlgN [Lachnospiraceae bacterium]|nr:flagellar export chaperone FlgN [Lachnospiraceae bacterium]